MRHVILLCSVLFLAHAASAQTITSTVEGIVVPARAWDVSAEVSNKISRLHFIEGQIVAEGDLLVEFDTGFKQLELDLAEARLAEAEVAVAEASEVLARQEELRETDTVSEARYRDALFALRRAEAAYQTLAVQRDMARIILDAQKLYAPFDGQISAPRYRENANVNIEDSREIATIVQLDPIHVRAPVTLERVLVRMQSGEAEEDIKNSISVELSLPDGSAYEHRGRPLTTSYDLDPETEAGVVIIEFPNPDRILRPGMGVIVTGYEN